MEKKIEELKAMVNERLTDSEKTFPKVHSKDVNFKEIIKKVVEDAVKSVFGQSVNVEVDEGERSYWNEGRPYLDEDKKEKWEGAVIVEGVKILTYIRSAEAVIVKPIWVDHGIDASKKSHPNLEYDEPNQLVDTFKIFSARVQ